ncbi:MULTISPECIES: hypothetical protein [Nocardiaceae]|uniref:DNA-binding protein n=1 Tax=Rhodococcoides kroppenstedtii TaxID=293050 RepID=A0ABS7NQB8_9NOCA|nr:MULTISPECIES: hypothetical protein [Rhodococcus]AMY18049.1 hypothetical protein A3Q40_00641 [Rhodococcus sp. PBTS 1]MBY6313615.1 DNA-binding protein [Rhodococcus kroppenstedtii]MBY6319962.1 DNA-binding protein [Rhodococcus kroppenstedtii]MBY6398901.1 DNA-binding protein [Rhodococcus kroppenstedtii]
MTQYFTVSGSDAVPQRSTTMQAEGLREVDHLEQWIVAHPEILGDDVMIVSTQFARWQSAAGDLASERLDILGLDSQGTPVVVELKRGGDKRVHLQALTYAALVARFTAEDLGAVHAAYLRTSESEPTPAEGYARLFEHVDGNWDPKALARPRIVLVAEHFPSQVLTTVSWLNDRSATLVTVECVQYSLFTSGEPSNTLSVGFSRIWPVDDLDDRLLAPRIAEEREAREDIAERSRGPRVASIAVRNGLIPVGAEVTLNLNKYIGGDVVAAVEEWKRNNPELSYAVWGDDPAKPLAWPGDPDKRFSLTRLAKHIITSAGRPEPASIPGGDVWTYAGRSVSAIVKDFTEGT